MPEADRRALERAIADLTRAARQSLGEQADRIVARLNHLTADEIAALGQPGSSLLVDLRAEWETALRQHLALTARLGQQSAAAIDLRDLPQFDLPHAQAQQWAAQHAAELVTDIEETTRGMLREAVSGALEQGVDLRALRERVSEIMRDAPTWRAERIANTEVMRAYQEGHVQAYRESGQVWGRRWVDGQEGACEVCRALHNQIVKLGEPFRVTINGKEIVIPEGQLAHPNDRCRITAVTYTQALEKVLPVTGEVHTFGGMRGYQTAQQRHNAPPAARGFAVDGKVYYAPEITTRVGQVLRNPTLLSDPAYGDALRSYVHEQVHLQHPHTGDYDDPAYRNAVEGLVDLRAAQLLPSIAQRLGYTGEVMLYPSARMARARGLQAQSDVDLFTALGPDFWEKTGLTRADWQY